MEAWVDKVWADLEGLNPVSRFFKARMRPTEIIVLPALLLVPDKRILGILTVMVCYFSRCP